MTLLHTLTTELAALVGHGSVADDPEVTAAYGRDQAALVPEGRPAVVVHARSTADVQRVLEVAHRRGVPVVPRGAGTGLAGAANAVDGCIVLSLTRMASILEIDTVERLAVVQPGVITADLAAAAAEVGLWYAPDPASAAISTIGGNLATNAGGLCCVKYGVTREAACALEVVLADGSVLRTGHRVRKSVAGYDLTSLFVGSEGTLGVITEATVRLRPPAAPMAVVVAVFDELAAAGRAVQNVLAATVPSMVELLDRTTLAAIEAWKPAGFDTDAAAVLLVGTDGSLDRSAELRRVETACADAGATYVAGSVDPEEAELLRGVRRLALPALERLGSVILDDVSVPIGAVVAMIEEVERIAAARGVTVAAFGHAGDGNLHPTIVYDPTDAGATARAKAAFDDIVLAALALGGTVTGEHGVGLLKRRHLALELDPVALDVHRHLKRALDPHDLLNPGKVIPPAEP